jgi:alpha-glucosidase
MTSSKIHFVMLLLQLASLGLVALADFSSCPGYRVDDSGSTGERLLLSLRKDAQAKVSRDCDKYGPDYQQVMASLEVESSTRLHVTIKDLDNRRWSVPSSVLPRPGRQFDFHESSSSHQSLFRTEVSKEQFGFSVIRRVPCSGRGPSTSLCDGSVIFNSSSSSLVFKEQYMELSTSLPLDANIYGLGEVQSTFRRDSKKSRTTIWSRGISFPSFLISVSDSACDVSDFSNSN